MVVVNPLKLAEVSRLEMFLLMVVWNAIYYTPKLKQSQNIVYLIIGKESRKPNSYEVKLINSIKQI